MYKIILTTTDNKKVAKSISDKILLNKLSPCVQILPTIESSYIWEGKIEAKKEFLLQIKTLDSNIRFIEKVIKDTHNYKVPEIVSFKIDILDSRYKEWFDKSINIKE